MSKREFPVRILNILAIIAYVALYVEGNVFQSHGLYVAALYVIYLVLKPFMFKQPSTAPYNFLFELVDIGFVIGLSLLIHRDLLLPLALFSLIRCALYFKIYFVLLSYSVVMIFMMFTCYLTEVKELFNLAMELLLLVIPSCIVCLVKTDAMKLDKARRELSEKLQLKNAVITELQKYSDIAVTGDPKKAEDMMRTDYVTQIPNRYFFEEMLKNGIMRAHEPSFNMGLIMVQIDNLYQYRLKYSYSTEHILVKRIHDLIAEQVKSNDFVARYEEDCIAVLLFNKDITNAQVLANVIYNNFEALKFNEPELNDIRLRIAVNDIENSMKENQTDVDTIKFLNRCKIVDFYDDEAEE
ncbi:MAG: diguanylate cyclase [Clostridia bacterium]|nr:diguanylate cyclase [Clostridia bacterium]